MEAIQKNTKEMKMKVEESEIGVKIRKGTTEFVHEHEEEINKVKSKVEETKTKVEEGIMLAKEKRDSSIDEEPKQDDVESTSGMKEGRDDPEIPMDTTYEDAKPAKTTSASKRPSIKKRVAEFASKVKPELSNNIMEGSVADKFLKAKSKVLGGPLAAATTTTEPKVVTENEASISDGEESVGIESIENKSDDGDGDSTTEKEDNSSERNMRSVELEDTTEGDIVVSSSSETDKPPKMTDKPEDGDWSGILPPPDREEGEDEIIPPAPSIPDYYKSNSKDEAVTKIEGPEKSHEKHINKLKKSIEDIRLKIETTIKDVSDKEKVQKIVNPLKAKLLVAKTKLVALKQGKSKSDDGDDNKEENVVAAAENATKKAVGNARDALKKAASKVVVIDKDKKKTAEDDKTDENDEAGESKLPSEHATANFVATTENATKEAVGNARDALKKAASKIGIIDDDKKKPNEDNNNNNMTDGTSCSEDKTVSCDNTQRESDVKIDTTDTDTADIVNGSDIKDDDAEGDNESK